MVQITPLKDREWVGQLYCWLMAAPEGAVLYALGFLLSVNGSIKSLKLI